MDNWYRNNRLDVDSLIDIVIERLKRNTSFPSEIPYDYTFNWECLRKDLIRYLYYSNDIALKYKL